MLCAKAISGDHYHSTRHQEVQGKGVWAEQKEAPHYLSVSYYISNLKFVSLKFLEQTSNKQQLRGGGGQWGEREPPNLFIAWYCACAVYTVQWADPGPAYPKKKAESWQN